MAIRVLIINRQLVFAVTLKQALEQTGTFDVHPFTTADAAFEFLRDHPQDVALVDFTLPGRSGAKMIQQLRVIQGDLAVIISPRQPNADDVARSLNLQGMIDMPFGARDIIPLIEQAVEQFQQNPSGFDELADDEPSYLTNEDRNPTGGQTRILGEDNTSQKQFGTTSLLGNDPTARDETFIPPAQTRNLGDEPASPPSMAYPAVTRDLSDDGGPSPFQTRNLDDANSPIPPPAASAYPAQTRNLDTGEHEAQPPPRRQSVGQTRDLDMGDDEAPPPRRRQPMGETRDFDMSPDPPEPPEVSSLENVLKSFGFDPPIGEEDTPAVPISDNDALRQFLATGDNSVGGGNFDDILGAIDSQQIEEPPRRESDFDALVKSMKSGDAQRGLPDRQQQLLDFVLTSGMDSVLQEIEKTKTGPLPEAPTPPSTLPEAPRERGLKGFQKLAKEEPPMPSLEEGGTVSDLMLGVSDRGFRNVLSLLRGDELDENAPSDPSPRVRLERHERFADFFNSAADSQAPSQTPESGLLRSSAPQEQESEYRADSFNFDDVPEADEEATVAQVILRAALEELDLPEGFSLNQLLTDIENRLSIHKLNVKPLPSWLMDTSAFRPVTEAEIREPDFLPEEMPPGEEVNLEAALEFEEPENFTGHTTRPSLTNQQALAGFPVEEDTLFDADFIQETLAPQIVPVEEEAPPTEEFEELPDWPEAEMSEGVADFVIQPPEELPFEAEIETDDFLMEQFAEETHSSNVFTSEEAAAPESETVLSGETWDINIQPEAAEGDNWDEMVVNVEPEAEVYSEEQSEFAEALDAWSIDLDTQQTADQWGMPTEAPVYEAEETYEEAYVESAPADLSWDLPVDIENEDTAAQAIPEDPYIAQLALNLTQFSLESSSEGTLLTRGDEVVAYAGHLSNEDASELRDAVNNDWDANADGARIRFITLPSSGKDYMLYSIRTENGFTLSMIFAGTTPLRVIRQQGHKLIAALESIPETQIEEMAAAIPEPVEVVESTLVPVETQVDEAILNVYTYVWLLHEPEGRLSDAVAHAMMSGLKTQLRELGWGIRTLQVHEDFVYLYAGVPGENPPHEIMRDLKRRSAEIAHAQNPEITPQMLWADAYLILTPGRELETEEILEFVNFQRMA